MTFRTAALDMVRLYRRERRCPERRRRAAPFPRRTGNPCKLLVSGPHAVDADQRSSIGDNQRGQLDQSRTRERPSVEHRERQASHLALLQARPREALHAPGIDVFRLAASSSERASRARSAPASSPRSTKPAVGSPHVPVSLGAFR